MNNKGFTLVELIATIALLAIISIISFVSINGVLQKSKISNCEDLRKNIISATKEYVSDNRYGTIDTSINAKYLIDKNYLKSKVKDSNGNIVFDDPFTEEYINPSDVGINIDLNDDYTIATNNGQIGISIKNSSGNEIVCSNGRW